MTLSEIKTALAQVDRCSFELPDGKKVPSHFHVTEIGKVSKHFIDCGGTLRQEEVVSLQLWHTFDYTHRLKPEKLLKIIALAEEKLGLGNNEVEVEYQSDTVGKYGLSFEDGRFRLIAKQTDCLAKDQCGNPVDIIKEKLPALSSCCVPGSGCC